MNGFGQLDSLSTQLVNCLDVDIETKKLLRRDILKLIVVSCKAYEKDPTFKNEIENLDAFLDWETQNK